MEIKKTFRRLSNSFFLSGKILYKRTPNLNLLRWVNVQEAEMIMNEVHSGVCSPHMNCYFLGKRILQVGYYWLTLEWDSFQFFRKYHRCQIHSDLIHLPSSKLNPMFAPWSFVAWGIDVISPIEPKASNGHRFTLVVVDYLTKWVETTSFKSVTKKAVVDFIRSNIIYCFRFPKTTIIENENHLMKKVCEKFKIVHWSSTPYHPKENGVVEAVNKKIKKILRRMVQGSRQWN